MTGVYSLWSKLANKKVQGVSWLLVQSLGVYEHFFLNTNHVLIIDYSKLLLLLFFFFEKEELEVFLFNNRQNLPDKL